MKISLPEGSLNSNRDPELTLSEILSKPTRALSPPLHGAPERPLSDTQAGFQAIVVRRLEVNSTVQTAERRLTCRVQKAPEFPNDTGQGIRSGGE
jgi:hypothetical protein